VRKLDFGLRNNESIKNQKHKELSGFQKIWREDYRI